MKKLICFLAISLAVGLPCLAQKKGKVAPLSPKEIGLATINRATSESIIEFLACDELEGRESGYNG